MPSASTNTIGVLSAASPMALLILVRSIEPFGISPNASDLSGSDGGGSGQTGDSGEGGGGGGEHLTPGKDVIFSFGPAKKGVLDMSEFKANDKKICVQKAPATTAAKAPVKEEPAKEEKAQAKSG